MQTNDHIVNADATAGVADTGTSPTVTEMPECAREEVMRNKDIWVHNILPFLGPGHFLFLALVCKQFRENYLTYFSKLKEEDRPMAKPSIFAAELHRAIGKNTFYSVAFSSVPCTEFWDKITQGGTDRLDDEDICPTLAKHGNLQGLKWARSKDFPWGYRTCLSAARGGHLDVFKWARENNCRWSAQTCAHAAFGGHLEVLKWARENNCPWNELTCAWAARGGHLEVLKWARENRCPWNEMTCAWAAVGGHLEVLKWAHGNGCAWNGQQVRGRAAANNQKAVLDWLNEINFDGNNA